MRGKKWKWIGLMGLAMLGIYILSKRAKGGEGGGGGGKPPGLPEPRPPPPGTPPPPTRPGPCVRNIREFSFLTCRRPPPGKYEPRI